MRLFKFHPPPRLNVDRSFSEHFVLQCLHNPLTRHLMSTTLSVASKMVLGNRKLNFSAAGVANDSAWGNPTPRSQQESSSISERTDPMRSSEQGSAEPDAFWPEVCQEAKRGRTKESFGKTALFAAAMECKYPNVHFILETLVRSAATATATAATAAAPAPVAATAAAAEAFHGGQQERAPILKTPKDVDFLSTAFAPTPPAPDLQGTRRARMTRRPPVAECRDETACLRPNVLTGHKVSPDTTRQKARHSKWNYSEYFNQPQPTRNVRQTDATRSHCWRTTKSAPNETPLTPWRALKR